MTVAAMDIMQLTTNPEQIDTIKCLSYLQKLSNVPINNKANAEHLLEHIAAIILKETNIPKDGNASAMVNQVVLNLAFRCYYQILHKHQLVDNHFGNLPAQLTSENEIGFLMLHAILLTQHWQHMDAQQLEVQCTRALIGGVASNSNSLLAILKALNLLVKKRSTLAISQVKLEHFYHCMQCPQLVGIREETLTLFNHCCKDATRAKEYFRLLVKFWPWTNRNKYYLLSCILNSHKLLDMLKDTKQSTKEFFAGLRMSLSYKSLLAASQYLVKSLSNQDSKELLQLAVTLLTNGTMAELQNFYAQWFARIKQHETLFELLQEQAEIVALLDYNSSSSSRKMEDKSVHYRFILIFSMFSKQLFALSKLHFFKISTELLTNCYSYALDAQLLIFRFLVNNLANFAIEDCLDFLYNFMQQHRCVESALFRNTMLGKLPTIINHISKHFGKALDASVGGCTLADSIKHYFVKLQHLIARDMHSEVYQPKIFALKLLEILYGSLYARQVTKNAKNCCMILNQKLGSYLLSQEVFDEMEMSRQLLKLLDDAQGFDDAQELVVKLLQQLNCTDLGECTKICLDYCKRSDVDECSLVTSYTQVAVHFHKDDESTLEMYEEAMKMLINILPKFKEDPLSAMKEGRHLFGYLNVVNELVNARQFLFLGKVNDILKLLEQILTTILDMLNLANFRKSQLELTAASFQDMDESLQLLVEESSFKDVDKHQSDAEGCRKFMLMSFWLTLKATCDLGTNVGCLLIKHAHSETEISSAKLKQCFYINVAVLTRCRHKGAIEAAGVSIGKLTKCITSYMESAVYDKRIKMLHSCIETELLHSERQVSTTRRGAGFSIMFLHIVKNDEPRERPILKRAMHLILQQLKAANNVTEIDQTTSNNHDRLEALTLHYLCLLAKDTELRNAMSNYYNDILMVAIANIENPEWTICNGALQLFGALVPKLVGQRQATEFEKPPIWEPSELSYSELTCILPQTCQYIIDYCAKQTDQNTSSTRSIILFLAFLSKVEHVRKSHLEETHSELLHGFRELSFRFLRHDCEQVRKLAATCFVRSHEFHSELPAALLVIGELLSQAQEENFFQGLVFTLINGVHKIQHESQHVWTQKQLKQFMRHLSVVIELTDKQIEFTDYTHTKLLDLLLLLCPYDRSVNVLKKLLQARLNVLREPTIGRILLPKKLKAMKLALSMGPASEPLDMVAHSCEKIKDKKNVA